MNVSYEELLHTGNYTLSGRLLAFQLNGRGRLEANYTQIETRGRLEANYTQIETYAKLSGERFMRNGKEYLDFQNIDYELKIGDFKTQFDDLFRDNPELTAVTNRVFNENSQALLPDFEEVFRNVLGNYMLGSLRRIFKTYFSKCSG
ncbi:hemolymph juvenile hormone binding protein (JHBP) [Popillia japonica]|uniref:Hemolymph juvenile hormone binding protein (JHBP) n=1 Tax=Popillia japonica TaxID=7064 RepID=A0AAW1NBK6_POPJA